MRKIVFIIIATALLLAVAACSNFADYYSGPTDSPTRFAYERVNRGRATRSASRNGYISRAITPRPGARHSAPESATRVVPHSPAHPQGQVIHVPDSDIRGYEPAPQAIQPMPHVADAGVAASPHVPAEHTAVSTPAPPVSSEGGRAATTGKELASHKTEFDAKDEGRATNITQASKSISGCVVQPGETFSYNQTVGPTIERRGYKEGIIFVQGEKKKGFGGGVCQVSTTLSIAADEAGMTIIERHDHSLPVTYAKEGEEAATSYGGIDFKFKNEKPFPVVIKSTVEGGGITVSIHEG